MRSTTRLTRARAPRGRAALAVFALLVQGAAAALALWSCSDEGGGGDAGAADAMPRPDAALADARVADGAADAAAMDAAVARDAADACASCASGFCGAGGCDPAVFVTSKTYTGAIGDGGVAAADRECASLAAAAGLPGTFRAWLSASSSSPSSPSSRFTKKSARPYRRIDGQRIVADFTKLATLESTISLSEKRVEVPFSYVWTATNGDATPTPDGGDCAGWTSEDPAVKGGTGESDDTVGEWTAFGDVPCSTMARLYCFEQ